MQLWEFSQAHLFGSVRIQFNPTFLGNAASAEEDIDWRITRIREANIDWIEPNEAFKTRMSLQTRQLPDKRLINRWSKAGKTGHFINRMPESLGSNSFLQVFPVKISRQWILCLFFTLF